MNILCNHVSFVDVTLDLLSHTSTLHSQTVLNTVRKSVFGSLCRLGQQILNSVLACQLHQLRLSAVRVHRVLPLPCDGVFVESERIRSLFLVAGGRSTNGLDRCRRPSGKESLERFRQRLGQLDVFCCRGHCVLSRCGPACGKQGHLLGGRTRCRIGRGICADDLG